METDRPDCVCGRFPGCPVPGVGALMSGAGVRVDRGPALWSPVSGTNIKPVSLAEATDSGPAGRGDKLGGGVLNQQENPSQGLSGGPCTEQELSPRETGWDQLCLCQEVAQTPWKGLSPTPAGTADNRGRGWNGHLTCSRDQEVRC